MNHAWMHRRMRHAAWSLVWLAAACGDSAEADNQGSSDAPGVVSDTGSDGGDRPPAWSGPVDGGLGDAGGGPRSFSSYLLATDRAPENHLAVFGIDSVDGTLSHVDQSEAPGTQDVDTGAGPVATVVHPQGDLVITANADEKSLSLFRFDRAAGLLSRLGSQAPDGGSAPGNDAGDAGRGDAGGPSVATPAPRALVMHPQGSHVYAVASDEVTVLAVDSANANVVRTGSVPTGATDAIAAAIDPGGKFLYVANRSDQSVTAYTIANGGAALAPIDADPNTSGTQNFPAAGGPRAVAIGNGHLLVANQNANTVRTYSIDANTGRLTEMATASTADAPVGVALDATNQFVYVIHEQSAVIGRFRWGSNGILVPSGTTPALHQARSVSVHPNGRYLYVGLDMGSIYAFSIRANDGYLEPLAPALFDAPRGGQTMPIVLKP